MELYEAILMTILVASVLYIVIWMMDSWGEFMVSKADLDEALMMEEFTPKTWAASLHRRDLDRQISAYIMEIDTSKQDLRSSKKILKVLRRERKRRELFGDSIA